MLDLADFVEAFPEVVAVAGYDIVWETKNLTCVTHDIIVNAVITPTVYGITYVLDGGTNPDGAPSRYTIKTKTFTPPVPTKEGYTFDGWYTENTFVNQVEQISQGSIGNVTLYAKWQQKSTEGLKYEQLQDGNYAVSGYDGDSDEVWIPSDWNGQPVTAIGDRAFENCRILTRVTIRSSVTSIGKYAFNNCSGLTNVAISNSVTIIGEEAFRNCGGLTSVTIPDSVTSISKGAFSGCIGLTSVTIGNSVNYVGPNAFIRCDSLVYNKFDNAYYLGNATNKYVVLVEAVSTNITSCTINDNCKVVAQLAFSGCSGLTSIVVKEGNSKYIVKNNCLIDTSTATLVLGCQTSVIPNDGSIKGIGGYAFSGCIGLTNVTVPDSVISIGEDAFSGCSGLVSVTIGKEVASIGSYAFSGCRGLTSVEIPDGVTSIGLFAFSDCSGLTSVIISDSVTSIGDFAFSVCSGLINVTIGSGVTHIGEYAFGYCRVEEVFYKGTAEQWVQISTESGNTTLTSATRYYYSDTQPDLNADGTAYNGNYWHYDTDGTTIVIWKKGN